jgi:membrane-associated phospholipid phosphatase
MLSLILIAAALLGRLQLFIRDWFIFISFIYLFDSLRGTIYILTCKLNLPVYTLYVIKIEKFLFGNIPSLVLQNWLLKTDSHSHFSWLEKFLTIIHGSHFIIFLFIGFMIWLYKSYFFPIYRNSFYLVVFFGILGYFIVPTVPPWMASTLFNLFPPIIRFNVIIFNLAIPDITSGFDVNPIAAMPSLHAAFPVLCSLLLWRLYKWKAFPFYLYAFLVIFTIVYTGDHYVTDILAGMILTIVCYLIAFRIKEAPSESGPLKTITSWSKEISFVHIKKQLMIGSLILIIGISIGSINKNQFENNPISYNLYVPKYIDFFNDEENYKNDYQVQYYFGNYYYYKKEYKKGLFYFERCLNLSKNEAEKKLAQQGINACNQLSSQKN